MRARSERNDRSSRVRSLLLTCAAAAIGLLPATAQASNTGKPRVPPSFLGAGCVETVDRSVDPSWSFDVGIPFEDTNLTEDEPPDGRRFQFFALCRQPEPLEVLPLWIDPDDATTAVEYDPTIEPPSPGESLVDSPQWVDCVQTITPIAERIPITCADTTGGVSWDTTGVPAGTYAIWAYTYEPILSLWTPRDGVVRVIDGDEASAGPAVSLSWPLTEVTAGLDEGVRVAGCVSGMPGTTLTLAWAAAGALSEIGDPAWQTFAEVLEPEATFDVAFVPPAEAEYEAIFFRAIASDPQGRSFTAFTRERVVFLGGCDAPDGGARSLPDFCEVGSGSPPVPPGDRGAGGCEPGGSGAVDETGSPPPTSSTGAATGSMGGTSAGADGGSVGDDGCGCVAPGRSRVRGLWIVLCLAGLRRRARGLAAR